MHETNLTKQALLQSSVNVTHPPYKHMMHMRMLDSSWPKYCEKSQNTTKITLRNLNPHIATLLAVCMPTPPTELHSQHLRVERLNVHHASAAGLKRWLLLMVQTQKLWTKGESDYNHSETMEMTDEEDGCTTAAGKLAL
jgi:hypothetical protein